MTDDLINQILDEIGLESIKKCEAGECKINKNNEEADKQTGH